MTTDPVILVAGVGGAGLNAASAVAEAAPDGVSIAAFDTDRQALARAGIDRSCALGTGAGGAGGDPEAGRAAALEASTAIVEVVSDADLTFVLAGLGGGTGSGAGPVVARLAHESGGLVFAITIRPFPFEGPRRASAAAHALAEFAADADMTITYDNAELYDLGPRPSLDDAFASFNQQIAALVGRVCSMLIEPGVVNLDIRDLERAVSGGSAALVGVGSAASATEAAAAAVTHAVQAGPSGPTTPDRVLLHYRARALPSILDMREGVFVASGRNGASPDVIWGATAAGAADAVSALLILSSATHDPSFSADARTGRGAVQHDALAARAETPTAAPGDEPEAAPTAAEPTMAVEPAAASAPAGGWDISGREADAAPEQGDAEGLHHFLDTARAKLQRERTGDADAPPPPPDLPIERI